MTEALNEEHASSVLSEMSKAWMEQLYCDANLSCGGTKIKAHKIVLASISDYFRSLFKYGSSETKDYEFDKDIASGSVLKAIVQYAYTGKIIIEGIFVQDLLVGASFLQIPFIINECENYMAEHIETQNVLDLIPFSNQYNLKHLLDSICIFITKHFYEITENHCLWQLSASDFISLIKNKNLSVVKQGIPIERPETEILKLVGKYVSIASISSDDFSEETIAALLSQIHFEEIPTEDIKSVRDVYPVLNCEMLSPIIKGEKDLASDLEPRVYSNKYKTLQNNFGRKYASGGQVDDIVEKFEAQWGGPRDKNDRPIHFKITIRRWDGRPVVGEIVIQYRSGKVVGYGGEPSSSFLVSNHEFSLEKDEVVTEIGIRCGWMIDSLRFTTNFGKTFGPYGGPGGSEWVEKPPFDPGYLHSMDGNVVTAQGCLGVNGLKFMWTTFSDKDRLNMLNEVNPFMCVLRGNRQVQSDGSDLEISSTDSESEFDEWADE